MGRPSSRDDESSVLESSVADCHPATRRDYMPLRSCASCSCSGYRPWLRARGIRSNSFRSRMDERGLRRRRFARSKHRQATVHVKSDLRDTYPFGLFASPMKDVVRLHVSSGHTESHRGGLHKEDVDVWTSVMVRCLPAAGCIMETSCSIAYGYGLFTGGWGPHYARSGWARRSSRLRRQRRPADHAMKDFGVTAICCTPTYFLHLIDRAAELGVELKELPLRVGVFGASRGRTPWRRHIEGLSSIEGVRHLRASEIIGPGVGCECRRHQGSAHLRGPLLSGDRRFCTGEPLADGKRRAGADT